MTVNLKDWLFDDRGNAIIGAAVTVRRTDGVAFTYNSITAVSHTSTTGAGGLWELAGLPDAPAGVYYDVSLTTSTGQVLNRKGGSKHQAAELAGLDVNLSGSRFVCPQGTVFPSSNLSTGEVFLRTDLNTFYVYTGTVWEPLLRESQVLDLIIVFS